MELQVLTHIGKSYIVYAEIDSFRRVCLYAAIDSFRRVLQ